MCAARQMSAGSASSTKLSLALLLASVSLCIARAPTNQLLSLRSTTSKCVANTNTTACPSPIPFCCSTGSTCISLASDNSAILCCPSEGRGCANLQPVNCTVSLQDQTRMPYYPLHTTKFDTKLSACGDGCCPLQYSCVRGHCERDNSQAISSVSHSPTTVSSTVSASVGSSTSSISNTSTDPSQTATAGPSMVHTPSSKSISPTAIIIGLLSGLIAGALITLLILWFLRRRRRARGESARKSAEIFPYGHSRTATFCTVPTCVSDPIEAKTFGSADRTEFLLRSGSANGLDITALPGPYTPNSQTHSSPATLRSGLPLTPAPPLRPQRGHGSFGAESVQQLQNGAGHQEIPSRVRDDSPLGGIERQNSDASYITTGSKNSSERRPSTETIQVLMPPPNMAGRGAVLSSATTWGQFLKLRE